MVSRSRMVSQCRHSARQMRNRFLMSNNRHPTFSCPRLRFRVICEKPSEWPPCITGHRWGLIHECNRLKLTSELCANSLHCNWAGFKTRKPRADWSYGAVWWWPRAFQAVASRIPSCARNRANSTRKISTGHNGSGESSRILVYLSSSKQEGQRNQIELKEKFF